MGVFTLVLVSIWILKSLLLPTSAAQFFTPGLRVWLEAFVLLFAVPAVYYSWKLFSLLRRELLWKIRRRLILAHIFIGAIPVLLVVVILYVSALLLYYQLSYFLILNQIGIHSSQVHAMNLVLRAGLEQRIASLPVTSGGLQSILDREAKYILAAYPRASIIARAMRERSSGESAIFAARNVRK